MGGFCFFASMLNLLRGRAAAARLRPAGAALMSTRAVTVARLRRALDVKRDPVDDPSRADPQVSRLHREMTSRHKWAVRNHAKEAEARDAAAAGAEEEEAAESIAESRRLHVDRLRIARAGDHIEVELMLTGVVEAPDRAGVGERVFKKRTYPDVGYSPAVLGDTRPFENDGFIDTLRGSMRSSMPRRF